MTARELRRWLEVKPDAVSDEMAFALLEERGVEPDRIARSRIWQALAMKLSLSPMAASENGNVSHAELVSSSLKAPGGVAVDSSGSGEPARSTRSTMVASHRAAARLARLLGLTLLLLAAAASLLWRTESSGRSHRGVRPLRAPLSARVAGPSEPSVAARAARADTPADSPATIQPAARPARSRARRPATLRPALNVQRPAPTPVDAPNDELDLLTRARRVIASAPARALALTDVHLAHFPASVFAPERDVLAIDALRRLGRLSEARARAARFVREHPDSIHAARVEGVLRAP